jgi:hypothetical protein
VTLDLAEFSRQERLDKVPGKEWPQSPSAQTNYAHVIILHPLPGGEMIADQTSPNTPNFIGADGRAYTAAANGHSALDLTCRYRPGQWDNKIRVIVT